MNFCVNRFFAATFDHVVAGDAHFCRNFIIIIIIIIPPDNIQGTRIYICVIYIYFFFEC